MAATQERTIPKAGLFSKYADGKDYLTIYDVSNLMKGQRCIADPIGWGGAFFECEFMLTCPIFARC